MPEKARLLLKLKEGGFKVPDYLYLPPEVFQKEDFAELQQFLTEKCHEYKVIARSAHPREEFFKGGTFDSLETYADVGGIKFARKHIINKALTNKNLSIRRQQIFNHAPEVDLELMGVIVMPYIDGISVMAKMVGHSWEFGYSGLRGKAVETDPYITQTPHDRRLVQMSKDIQAYLGFRCEIEYIFSENGDVYVVQAKDISHIEILDKAQADRAITLDGVRRIRKKRNYRERPIFVMNNREFYLDIIGRCEDCVLGAETPPTNLHRLEELISAYEKNLESFALRHERFAVLGLTVQVPEDLFQVANHYLDETPDLQKDLSQILRTNMYKIDQFLAESDTLIAKNRYRLNLATHDAYGVDTIRNPLWHVFWQMDKHDEMVKEFDRLGFKTGDVVGIDIGPDDRPTIYRL
jgi:hypothetical protein